MKRYTKEHTLKVYEVTCFGELKLLGLFNILQEVASEHADSLKIGYQACCQAGVAWVAASYRVDIKQLPKIEEKILIETWIADCLAVTSQRCYRIKDAQGNILIEGLTNWALIDTQTLRPVAITKKLNINMNEIDGEKLAFSGEKIRLVSPERIDCESHFISRFDEMDTNYHINNAIYPTWAAESLPADWQEKNVPKQVQINFKNPTKAFEKIDIFTLTNEKSTLHKIQVENEIKALVQINWKEREND